MSKAAVSLNKSKLHEGVRLCKTGSSVILYSANGVEIDRLHDTDIAECVEALQREKVPHDICVADQIVQITR